MPSSSSESELAVWIGASDSFWKSGHVPDGHGQVDPASSDRTGRPDPGQQAEGVQGHLDLRACPNE